MYIRTKDGVYEVEGRKFYDALKRKHYITTKGLAIKEDDIINQSENLEELCDEFVIEWIPTNHKDIFTIDKYSKEVVKSCIGNSKTKVYGAIWTSKGLIYVAKMDNEGKLVLI